MLSEEKKASYFEIVFLIEQLVIYKTIWKYKSNITKDTK